MVLQDEGTIAVGDVLGQADVLGRAFDFGAVLYYHAIVDDGDTASSSAHAVHAPAGGSVDDVVGLPLTGRTTSVNEGDGLLVNGTRLTVGVGGVVEAIEHLHLVATLHEDATVAPALALAFHYHGRPPFHVQLVVAEDFFGINGPAAGLHGHGAVLYLPRGGCAVFVGEFIEVRAVEQHNGVARCGGAVAWGDDLRHGLPSLGELGVPFFGCFLVSNLGGEYPLYAKADEEDEEEFFFHC